MFCLLLYCSTEKLSCCVVCRKYKNTNMQILVSRPVDTQELGEALTRKR